MSMKVAVGFKVSIRKEKLLAFCYNCKVAALEIDFMKFWHF